MIKKVKNYYEYHGLLETLKAIIRKIFHIKSVSLINKMKNFDLNSEIQDNNVILKSNRNILNGLSMKEIKILEKLILYEKEALGFSIGILRNNANIYEEANQNDK